MMKSKAHPLTVMEESDWSEIKAGFPVNIKASIESGQPLTFHSDHKTESSSSHLFYTTQKGAIEIRYGREPASSFVYRHHGDYDNRSAREEVIRRLGLRDEMQSVYKAINTEEHMETAIGRLYGMRVTENDPWETTLCFVISQFNNIKRIRGIVRQMITRYGREIEANGEKVKAFPSSEEISGATIEELRRCGAGFRARYIKSIAERCSDDFELNDLYGMEYGEAKELLMQLDGIGDKVADCILLMGYKRLNAFPIDVWIKRSMEGLYFKGRRRSIREIHEFAEGKWGGYAGYAQQYLFHTARLGIV